MFFENSNAAAARQERRRTAAAQREGRRIGLTKQQVKTPNFGWPTIYAIKNGRNFDEVQGLNNCQIMGLLEHNLTRQQVETPNFGWHTNTSIREGASFEQVQGLDAAQTITRAYDLTIQRIDTQIETLKEKQSSLRQEAQSLIRQRVEILKEEQSLNEEQTEELFQSLSKQYMGNK